MRARRKLRLWISTVAAILVATAGVVLPATAAHASTNVAIVQSQRVDNIYGEVYYWDFCQDYSSGSRLIILEQLNVNCGRIIPNSSSDTDMLGWTFLTPTAAGHYEFQVCESSGSVFTARVEVATASGASTGRVIAYPVSNNTCLWTTSPYYIGYPIRKFRAVYTDLYGDVFASGWWAAPPL